MPPALSDDEMSDGSGVGAVTTPPPSKRSKKAPAYADSDDDDASDSDAPSGRAKSAQRTNGSSKKKEEPVPVADDDDEEDEEGDEEEEEYEVQEITGHMLDDKKQPRFRVIWKGYPDEADHTWEPEDNLVENASIILNDYYSKIGGREKVFEKPTKGKKRGRPSAAASASAPTSANSTPNPSAAKRSRKSEIIDTHPSSRESPVADATKLFKPPAGSWEDEVVDVEMFRGNDGELRVFLTWKNGNKSQHVAQQAYVRCPQRILKFYESRISFKTPAE